MSGGLSLTVAVWQVHIVEFPPQCLVGSDDDVVSGQGQGLDEALQVHTTVHLEHVGQV